MSAADPTISVVGRFPPPVDGQANATRRLAEVLESVYDVERVDLSFRGATPSPMAVARHYWAATKAIAPRGPTVWPSVSPRPLGHWRDLACVLTRIPVDAPLVAVVHWGDFHTLFQRARTALTARALLQRVTLFVFLSENLAASCERWIPRERREAIPNTIDESLVPTAGTLAASQLERTSSGPIRVLYLSNMIRTKGYLDVLEAVGILRRQGCDVRADFAGRWLDSGAEKEFVQKAAQLNLAEVVCHHGAVSDRARVAQLYLSAHVCVLPTYYPTEAQPLALIEALSNGTPIITTEKGGLPSMIEDRNVVAVVEPQDPAGVAAGIARMADRKFWRRTSERSVAEFDLRFSTTAVTEQWTRLVERLL